MYLNLQKKDDNQVIEVKKLDNTKDINSNNSEIKNIDVNDIDVFISKFF